MILPKLSALILLAGLLAASAVFMSKAALAVEGEGEDEGEIPKPAGPATTRDVLAEGISLFENKSYDKAKKCFDEVIQKEPENTLARIYRGLVLVMNMNYAAALDDFDAVIKAKPNVAKTYVQRGRALMALNRFPEAREDFLKAKSLDPEGLKDDKNFLFDVAQAEALIEAGKKTGVGCDAPEFKLMGAAGKPASLSEFKGKEYVVLVFYTTYASQDCRGIISQFNEFQGELGKRGGVAMAISTDALKWGIELVENKGFTIRILSDEDAKVAGAYGVLNVRYKDPPIALPSVVIVDKAGKVAYRRVSYDPRDRDGPEKILKELEVLIKRDEEKAEKEKAGGKDAGAGEKK